MRTLVSIFFALLLCLASAPLLANPSSGLKEGPILVATQPNDGGSFTLESTIYTVLDGATNLQQDLVLSSDNQLVVFSDIYLDPITNVSDVYPDRARDDGRYYVIDFTLRELKGLQFEAKDQQYLMGFEEQLALLKRLKKRTGNVVGIFPRLIKTWFHRNEGRDLCGITLSVLKQHDYFSHEAPVYLQSYDTDALKRAHEILMPIMQTDINLIQLIDTKDGDAMLTDDPFPAPYSYDWIYTGFGMRSLATYVDGIGFTWVKPEDETQIRHLGDLFDQATRHKLSILVEINAGPDEEHATFTNRLDTFVDKLGVKAVKTNDLKTAAAFFSQSKPKQLTIQEILPQLTNRGQGEGVLSPPQSPLTILRELQ